MRHTDHDEGGGNRMIRRLFTIASGISLLLCVATVALWVRSYRIGEEWLWMDRSDGSTDNHANKIRSGNGRILFVRFQSSWMGKGVYHFVLTTTKITDPAQQPVAGNLLGVYWLWQARKHVHGCLMPYGVIVLATTVVPVLKLADGKHLKKSNSRPGRCSNCGYDLRASKERCPECGTPISVATTSS
jgi:hypothetical protein